VTLELDPHHAEVAQTNLDRAGVGDRVEIRVGRAVDSLARLRAEGAGPFDLTFIDADKPGNPKYVAAAVDLSHPGSLVVVDNVVRAGAVIDATTNNDAVRGTRRMFEVLAADDRVDATAIQTVGMKGHDGLAFALVR